MQIERPRTVVASRIDVNERAQVELRGATKIRPLRDNDSASIFAFEMGLYIESSVHSKISDCRLTPFWSAPKQCAIDNWMQLQLSRERFRNAVLSVATADEKVVGIAGIVRLSLINLCAKSQDTGELFIAVENMYRGQGVGSRLLEDVLDKSKGRFDTVDLRVDRSNFAAQALYKKFGFEILPPEDNPLSLAHSVIDTMRLKFKK